VTLNPYETNTVTGIMRKTQTCQLQEAVTENIDREKSALPTVCPRVESVNALGSTARIPVRICNMSAKIVTLKENTKFCILHQVSVLRNVDPF